MTDIAKLKSIFKNQDLLTQALTHKSWVNEHKKQRESNERLEFLGDAVLEFIVSKEIYERHPDKEEGFLTALRANLVNTQNLANIARKLNVGKALFLAKGEEDSGGRENPSLLADTIEAIIGAFFIDQGIKPVYEFIKEHIIAEIPEKLSKPLKDAKSRLQEYIQSQKLPTPRYKVIEELGPDHSKKFIVEVSVEGRQLGKGEGKSKSTAEQKAADNALSRL
ncbi:MAG: ribonuclease III [Patescibacteria group bacterium]